MNHREIGRILGFPECCIHEFINDGPEIYSAEQRGAVYFRRENGTIGYYIPCTECLAGDIHNKRGLYIPPDAPSDIHVALQFGFQSMFVDKNMQPILDERVR